MRQGSQRHMARQPARPPRSSAFPLRTGIKHCCESRMSDLPTSKHTFELVNLELGKSTHAPGHLAVGQAGVELGGDLPRVSSGFPGCPPRGRTVAMLPL